ncbi:transmembrane channel-like protein 2 isoform X2 [Corticium candelabrum]|uniref:transmembrane channel-like protein 2 isoform X2 n=1 Tax=Corticium candelabrum TaxID=121492 RepID=UPI002E26AE59|nr:transmembrane channel-like protein 2 isoform X2 [Corticium candelabrum]
MTAKTMDSTPLLDSSRPSASRYTEERVLRNGTEHCTNNGDHRYPRDLSKADYVRRLRYASLCKRNRSARSTPPPIPEFRPSENLLLEAQLDIYDLIVEQQEISENVRAQPWPMHVKLNYVRELTTAIDEKKEFLGKLNTLSQKSFKAIDQAAKTAKNWSQSWPWTFWKGSIKLIEGYFGSGVGAYFSFLRRIFILNLLLVLLILLPFVVIPQIISGTGFSSEFLSGLENTIIFYGYYDTGSLALGYNISIAFLLCNVGFFVFSFVYIIRKLFDAQHNADYKSSVFFLVRMCTQYHSTKLAGLHNNYPFSWLVLVSWDFEINKEKGAHSKQAALVTLMKEELTEAKEKQKQRTNSMCSIISYRFISNLIALGILGGSGYLVYYFVNRSNECRAYNSNVFVALVERFELPLVLLALRVFVPLVFQKLVLIEHWHPRTALKWTLVRTTTLYLGNIVVLLISLLQEATRYDCQTQGTNSTVLPTTIVPTGVAREYLCCWETYVGVEIVKVVLIDFLGEIIAILVTDILRALFVHYICGQRLIGYHEFNISSNVLGLIYGQGLIWLGTFFSPLLPAMQVVKLFLIFYFHRFSIIYTNIPPKKIFRASRSGNFLQFLLLFMLFVSTVPLGYTLAVLQPSTECGPFRTENRVYKVLADELPTWASSVLEVIVNPAVTIPVIVFLLLVILYYKVMSSSYSSVIKDLQAQLHFERLEGRREVFEIGRKATSTSAIRNPET